jgi:hypothetical protein
MPQIEIYPLYKIGPFVCPSVAFSAPASFLVSAITPATAACRFGSKSAVLSCTPLKSPKQLRDNKIYEFLTR